MGVEVKTASEACPSYKALVTLGGFPGKAGFREFTKIVTAFAQGMTACPTMQHCSEQAGVLYGTR